jgi:hypothetical protein
MKIKGISFFVDSEFLGLWICFLILGGAVFFIGISYYSYMEEVWSLTTMFRPRPAPFSWYAGNMILACIGATLALLGLAGILGTIPQKRHEF